MALVEREVSAAREEGICIVKEERRLLQAKEKERVRQMLKSAKMVLVVEMPRAHTRTHAHAHTCRVHSHHPCHALKNTRVCLHTEPGAAAVGNLREGFVRELY